MMTQISRALAFLLLLAGNSLYAQSNSDPPGAAIPDSPVPAVSRATTANAYPEYKFPDGRQQFRNYLYFTFGPPGLISTAVGAGLDQNKPAPPEWDSGVQGYGERYGWRLGMNIISKTTEYSLGAAMHEDVAFHRCQCSGFFPRTTHALTSTLTAKTEGGRTVFSIPSLVSPYVGSFAAVNAWYPSRYDSEDSFRIGSTSFMFKAIGNLIGEFLAPRR